MNIYREIDLWNAAFISGLVGLALSYGLSMTATLSAVVQYCIETEKQLVSVERTLQYLDTVEPERWEGFIKVLSREILLVKMIVWQVFNYS